MDMVLSKKDRVPANDSDNRMEAAGEQGIMAMMKSGALAKCFTRLLYMSVRLNRFTLVERIDIERKCEVLII
jgi:hypothetical protein